MKEFLNRVTSLDIQSDIIHPQSGDDQDPTGNLALLINIRFAPIGSFAFHLQAVVLEKMEGFNPFDFWNIILTSSRRIGYHRNLPVQETGADGFKLALYLISSGLEGVDARIVNTLHDEIIVDARDAIEDQVKEIVKESMERAFEKMIPEVPFVAEIRVADLCLLKDQALSRRQCCV